MAISFDEGAPKDRFTFANTYAFAIEVAKVTLALSGSKSGLNLDTSLGYQTYKVLDRAPKEMRPTSFRYRWIYSVESSFKKIGGLS